MACYAIVAACQYPGTEKELTGTSEDAALFSQFLQEDLAVPAENITLMDESGERPPTAAGIRKALNWYIGNATDGDSLLLYFAGHGTSIQAADGPRRALVCSDLDLLTRYDLNTVATTAPEGVKFTIVADASNASELLPHPPVNGADAKEVEMDNTGRKLGPKKYVKMFQAAYPNAGMTMENTMQVLRARFPLEGGAGFPGADGAGGVPQRRRVRRAGPLGEGIEGDGDDEEEDDEGRRARRERDDDEGDARRRRRHEREEGREGREDDEEEEDEEGGRRPGRHEGDEEEEEPEEPTEEAEEQEEPAEGEEPTEFPGFATPPMDDGPEEGDEEEDPAAEPAPEPTDGAVGERGVLFSASWKKSVVADGNGFTAAFIAAVKQAKESGEAVTNRSVIDTLMAIMEESNPRMVPTLACGDISAEEPFFGC